MTTAANTPDLARTTMHIKLRFGLLGNSKKVSNTIVTADTDKDLIRVSKNLLDSRELEAIRQLDGDVKRYIANICLPFEDAGVHLIPNAAVTRVIERLNQFNHEREELIDQFIAAYPHLKERAKAQLKDLYNAGDYPPADYVRSCFRFSWQLMSFGVPENLEEINAGIFQDERNKAADQVQEAAQEITKFMRESFADLVEHLVERLKPGSDGRPKIIRESTVANLKEFLNNFELRNVTNDQELKALVERARNVISVNDAEALRTMEGLRNRVCVGLETIQQQVVTMIKDRPRRKFRKEDDAAA